MLAMLLTACSNSKPSLESDLNNSSISSNGELSAPAIGSPENNFNVIIDGVYTTYDKSKYENISAPKIYYADFQKIEEKTFLDLFLSKPTYSAETQEYLTENEHGWYTAPTDNVPYYTMSYYTTIGFDSRNLGSGIFSDYSTTTDLDFMALGEMQTDFTKLTSSVLQTGVEITSYALSKNGATRVGDNIKTPEKWSGADEFYYINARQSVDGIPIFIGVVGGPHKGGYTYGTTIEAIYTENGLEFLTIMMPYKIKSEAPLTDEFITLTQAEEIIKGMYENLLTFKEVTLVNAELVYIPIYSSGDLLLTPAWEFSDAFGPLYRINAYTGEEIR